MDGTVCVTVRRDTEATVAMCPHETGVVLIKLWMRAQELRRFAAASRNRIADHRNEDPPIAVRGGVSGAFYGEAACRQVLHPALQAGSGHSGPSSSRVPL
jgi:hypothetical protein